jgi:translation initiation factor 3 subunit J
MADKWDDDDDDEWDVDDDDLDKRLGLKGGAGGNNTAAAALFDDEEDLAVTEKALRDKVSLTKLKKKGNALAEKKAAEAARKEEEEIARRAVELEAEAEASLSPEEFRALQRRQVEDADHALTNDLFGGGGGGGGGGDSGGGSSAAVPQAAAVASSSAAAASDKVVIKDMKDHLKHARKVAECLREHGQIHLSTAFFKECLTQSEHVLDDDAVAELIKTLNVMKNDMVAAAKRKVKGQAQKSKKVDKVQAAQARKIQVETFGDNDQYDNYDQMGEQYEDSFF